MIGAYVQNVINQYSIPRTNSTTEAHDISHPFIISMLSELKTVTAMIGDVLVFVIGILYYKGILSFEFGLRLG
jgi:fumarate reductase subunit D